MCWATFFRSCLRSSIPASLCFSSKPSLNFGSVDKAFLFWDWQFFRNKTFLLFEIESWNFQNLFEKEFYETSQTFNSIRQPIEKDENNNCLNKLNKLELCEVSRNSISNWTWKFQLSILKNKKVLCLKKNCQYQNKKALCTDSIFQKVLILLTLEWPIMYVVFYVFTLLFILSITLAIDFCAIVHTYHKYSVSFEKLKAFLLPCCKFKF